MRKSNTDSFLTQGFLLMCVVNFLLYASVYMVIGALPLVKTEVVVRIFPFFLLGGLLAGPFHAYLADTFRRKHVLLGALAGIALTMATATYIRETWYVWVALVQGACLALAIGAGTTISIDITQSGYRTSGNMLFAFCGRLGMVCGMIAGVGGLSYDSLTFLTYLSAVCVGVAFVLALLVYVSFRAPIGVSLCSIDRFWLPRAWLPAFNVGILAYAFGIGGVFLLDVAGVEGSLWTLPLFLLPVLTPVAIKIFVKLSHHCQRATGNMTFNLLMDTGLLAGIWTVCYMEEVDKTPIGEDALMYGSLALALLMYVFATRPYYKKKRVR